MIYRCVSSLHIYSEKWSVEEISEFLGQQPDQQAREGERASPRNPRSAVHRGSTWICSASADGDRCVTSSVETIAGLVQDRLAKLTSLEGSETWVHVNVFSDSWQVNFALVGTALSQLADLGADVEFSVYSAEK